MAFYKQTTDFDLGETSIENIFISEFMPMANGTAVKVYLLGFKFSQEQSKKEITNETIAKHLNIPLEDVLRSWDFWENKKVIRKIENGDHYDIEFVSLRQLLAKNLYVNKKSTKAQTNSHINLIEANKNPEIKKMFYAVDQIMRRQLVPNERNNVLDWIYKDNIDLNIIVSAFKYCVEERGVKHINYVASVVRGWRDQGILSLQDLEAHFAKSQTNYNNYKTIYRTLGYANKLPSAGDKEIMDIWLDDFKLDIDFIVKVLTETSKRTSNINMNYMHKAIETLVKQDIRTIEGFENHLMNRQKTSAPKNKQKNNKFHNFNQREKLSKDELERKLGIKK